ncbi:MAG: type II toxin-antitoxin system HicB family antitoxin [Chloroflexi bacterium]|nr:type II toxin-antitoxin system HicB family antitoxin [Chloroflexota bacterium]
MSGNVYIRVANDGTFLASLAELPGCTARGTSKEDALAKIRAAFRDYLELLTLRGVSTEHWKGLDPAKFVAHEWDMTAMHVLPPDEKPLEEHELRDFLHQMEASRSALLALVRGLSADELERKPTETAWSVREALEHIMLTQVSLLSRMERWPDHEFATLQAVHRMAFQRFTVMEPSDWVDHPVMGVRFTTRKVMRRILEHEYEHLDHIRQILASLGSQRPPE